MREKKKRLVKEAPNEIHSAPLSNLTVAKEKSSERQEIAIESLNFLFEKHFSEYIAEVLAKAEVVVLKNSLRSIENAVSKKSRLRFRLVNGLTAY